MVTITAQQILNETGWTSDNFGGKENLEYLIDKAINWVNLQAGTSISNMTGVVESKTVTVTSDQAPVIKAWIELLCRAYADKGPQVAVGGMSVTEVISDPHYKLMTRMANQGINRLRGRTFERT